MYIFRREIYICTISNNFALRVVERKFMSAIYVKRRRSSARAISLVVVLLQFIIKVENTFDVHFSDMSRLCCFSIVSRRALSSREKKMGEEEEQRAASRLTLLSDIQSHLLRVVRSPARRYTQRRKDPLSSSSFCFPPSPPRSLLIMSSLFISPTIVLPFCPPRRLVLHTQRRCNCRKRNFAHNRIYIQQETSAGARPLFPPLKVCILQSNERSFRGVKIHPYTANLRRMERALLRMRDNIIITLLNCCNTNMTSSIIYYS